MRQQSAGQSVVTIAAVLMIFLLSGCIAKDSPAPGCVEYIGVPPAGGCFGKTVILDLHVEPAESCLDVTVNNCNGGVLEIQNACDEAFTLGGVIISPGGRANLDVVQASPGYLLVEVGGNFSNYVPEADERVEIVGTLGSLEIKVAFTKTRKLCE